MKKLHNAGLLDKHLYKKLFSIKVTTTYSYSL